MDAFLRLNEKDILTDAGKISMEIAKNLAVSEYEKFNRKRLEYDKQKDDEEFEKIARDFEKNNRLEEIK